MRARSKISEFLPYIALIGLSGAFFFYLYSNGINLAVGGDELAQMLPGLTFLENTILGQKGFWSWSLGLGGDWFSELSYYYTGSILFYIELFIKTLLGLAEGDIATQIEAKYFIGFLRQSSNMVVIMLLFRQEQLPRIESFISSVAYGMSTWFMYYFYHFSFMTWAMFWLPCLAIGLNHYLKGKSWLPLAIIISLTVSSSFYFGFQTCLFLVSFFFVTTCRNARRVKDRLLLFLKLGAITIVGLLLSAWAFLPAVGALLNADRTPVPVTFHFLPTFQEVETAPSQLFFGTFSQSLVSLPLFILLFFNLEFKRFDSVTKAKTSLALFWILMLFIPITSNLMNGMSVGFNRWNYIPLFAVCYALPNWLVSYKNQEPKSLASLVLVLLVGIIGYKQALEMEMAALSLRVVLIAGILGSLLLYYYSGIKNALAKLRYLSFELAQKIGTLLLATTVIISSTTMSLGILDTNSKNAPQWYQDKHYSIVEQSLPEGLRGQSFGEEFGRVDNTVINARASRSDNESWLSDDHSTAVYNSLVPGNVHRWVKRLYDVTTFAVAPNIIRGFDDRFFLEVAWGVKKKTGVEELDDGSGRKNLSPYGTYKSKQEDDEISFFNPEGIGFDMWYESIIPEEDFQKMDFAQRDAALLQGTTVSSESKQTLPKTVLEETTSIENLSINEFKLKNCYIDDSGSLIAEEGARLTLPLQKRSNDEGEYLLSFTMISKDDSQYYLTVNGKEQLAMPSTYAWRYPLNDFSFKIPAEDDEVICEVTPGVYELSNIRLAWNSYSEAVRWISERNKVNIEDLKVLPDHISGKVLTQSAGILVLSMPYSDGWSCWVDGKEHPTVLANHAFLGIELEPGQHEIELSFFPKTLKTGLIVTIATLILLILYTVLRHRSSSPKHHINQMQRT